MPVLFFALIQHRVAEGGKAEVTTFLAARLNSNMTELAGVAAEHSSGLLTSAIVFFGRAAKCGSRRLWSASDFPQIQACENSTTDLAHGASDDHDLFPTQPCKLEKSS